MTLIAETQGDPASMAGPLEEMVRSMDANMPVWNVRTMDDIFEQRSVKVAQLMIGVVGSVGVMGLSMALVGLYAVVAYQVSRRRREIGIRMAIGATRVQVMKLILRQAAVMAIPGVLIGAVLSFAAGPAFTMGLDMPVLGPTAMSLIAIALLATTFLAAAIPARRASKIDPQEALRQE
ncbi:MAG: FtsX-like permease family protein [Acidobacteria bacterium]|nr:FtsX-like permease family protein [Acidobacteriota bacterium]